MCWFGKEIAGGSIRAVAFYITTTYILPVGVPIVTVIIGYVFSLPWFWIWLGALAAFAFISTGLLRFDEWRTRLRVEGKLNFESVRVVKHLTKSGSVESLCLGFALHNSAVFPIEYELQSLQTAVDGKFPPKKPYTSTLFTIPAGGSGWFDDYQIDIPSPPKDQAVEGCVEFVIKYGRPGRLIHELGKKLQVFIGFDGNGDTNVANWNEMT